MKISTRLIYSASKKAYRSFVRDTENPEDATARLWKNIWNEIENAAYWKEHRPQSSPTLDDFPLTTYKDYQATIEKSYQSGESLLASSKILCFGQSSGTTTKIPKVYPITATFNRQTNAVNHAYTHAFLREFPEHYFGKALFFVANALKQTEDDKIERAHMSNYGIRKMPPFVFNYSSVVPRSIYLSSENYFNQWAAVYALAGEMEYTTMILPGIFHGLYKRIQNEIDTYWPYLEGTKQLPAPLPKVRCSTKRLRHLKAAFESGNPTISDIWPTLHTVFSWRSGISQFQEQELRSVLGNVPIYNLPYCATEGYFTVPVKADSLGGVVHPGANILEFIPVESEPIAANLLKPWELEEGKQYELVMTSTMGLVRYRMLDIIKCTGFFNRAPVIEFMCKAAHVVRLSKTNIFETNLAEALQRADFHVKGKWIFGPNKTGDALRLYLQRPAEDSGDFENSQAVQELAPLLERADLALQDVNFSYGNERRSSGVTAPEIIVLPHDHVVWAKGDILTTKPRLLLSVAP